ncbi:PhnD/SsuA/transferrin family substrate-binding protein [Paracoccaceae bacterium]|jgi:ABC-type phosphate/phosphonate transport system substrate-binding protein|nr:PhnD/SsuA/transferrin family substrate-binding protein [Paracoccaceae bacterium]
MQQVARLACRGSFENRLDDYFVLLLSENSFTIFNLNTIREMPMIASLPMYARPELDYAISLLWDLIRKNLSKKGIPAPITLSQDAEDISSWLDPGLVLSQTCGMPYRNILHGKVQLVGTPNYDLPNCLPGHYFSAIVVRKNDPRLLLKDYDQAVLAYNMEVSQSGYAAPLNHAAAQGIHFPNRVESHGHLKSAEMVVSGKADIAAIDAVTWMLIERHEAFASKLRVLERTTPTTPVLPLITSLALDADQIFDAVKQAIQDLPQDMRDDMLLKGIVKIPASEYLNIPNPE